MSFKVYKSKYARIPGTSHAELIKAARYEYHKIQKRTPRRQAYVRSKYFSNGKVFINQFWTHLAQKHPGDQVRRVKFFVCAIDTIRHSLATPDTILAKDDRDMLLHRFYGVSKDGFSFCVQIRENKRTARKDFMSVFPALKKK